MKHYKIAFIIVIALLFYACTNPPFVKVRHSIWLKNNDTLGRIFLISYLYPDTSLPITYEPWELVGMPIGERIPYELDDEEYRKLKENTLKKLCIFIFDSHTIDNYSWNEVRKEYKILRRYDLSLQDIQDRGFIIEYP